MATNFTTRSGIEPCQRDVEPYSITTQEVQKYLQNKINVVLNQTIPELQGKVNVGVITIEAGRKFLPFVVLLPKTVLDERVESINGKIPGIYQGEDVERNSSIRKPIAAVLDAYRFNKYDVKAFFSDDWRRRAGISRSTSSILKRLATPRLQKVGENDDEVVIEVLLDPLRIFHDMLKFNNPEGKDNGRKDPRLNQPFYVEITKWKKLKVSEFRFTVLRKLGNQSGKGNKSLKEKATREINAKFRSSYK